VRSNDNPPDLRLTQLNAKIRMDAALA